MKRIVSLTVILCVALLALTLTAAAQGPGLMNYQGYLTNPGGDPLDGDYEMTFTIYNASTDGGVVWSEPHTYLITVTEGVFDTVLGYYNSITDDVFSSDERWLQITVEGEDILPRTRLTTAPYAFRVSSVNGATGGYIGSNLTVMGDLAAGDLWLSNVSEKPEARLSWGLYPSFEGEGAEITFFSGYDIALRGRIAVYEDDPSYGNALQINPDVANDVILAAGGGEVSIGWDPPHNLLNVVGHGTDYGGVDGFDEVLARFRRQGHTAISVDALSYYDPIIYFSEGGEAVWGLRCDYSEGREFELRYHGRTGQQYTALSVDDEGAMSGYSPLDGSTGYVLGHTGDGGALLLYPKGDPNWSVLLDGGEGRIITNVLEVRGADLSEQFQIREEPTDMKPAPGMVVRINKERPGELIISTEAYDRRVAGIISGAGDVMPGLLMGQKGSVADGEYPVALTGRVWCLVDASYGPIQPGDLLTTSNTPGHAMKATDRERAYGAVIGKAMTSLESGKGLVLVLVNLQ